MVFWRRKKNQTAAEEEARDEAILHPKGEPGMEPPVEYDPEMDEHTRHELQETEEEVIDSLNTQSTPDHTPVDDTQEAEDLSDHTEEGGWLSRLTSGLSKSTNKITGGLSDLVTKRKLDQATLDELEEVLISADLGPKTAAKIIEDFSQDRFGKDIDEHQVKTFLATSIDGLLSSAEKPLNIIKPEQGPFVILVCGVNGAGKTTTIGKMAHQLHFGQGHSIMIAAADTFRAAAIDQLREWSSRVGCAFFEKEPGADAAAVAFEAYEKAVEDGIDVLMIDTAGRLQNKSNLMEELQKMIRVLQKKDVNLPHETLLVLDSTTGQNAFSQVEIFKDMVDVSGLIVTKLDGSAKGGVLVGLVDQFALPVYAIGVGEGVEDLQNFSSKAYAQSLLGVAA